MNWGNFFGSLRPRLSRVISSGDFIPQVDGLRFMSAMLVVVFHTVCVYLAITNRFGVKGWDRSHLTYHAFWMNWVLEFWTGVSLFCVISGFVLSLPFARAHISGARPPSTRLYLLRRLIRLEPPYVLNICILYLATAIPVHGTATWQSVRQTLAFFWPHFAASVVYLHAAVFGEGSWISGVAWTLEIEVQFYLLLPVLAQLFRIRNIFLRRLVLVALTALAGLVFQRYVSPSPIALLRASLPFQLHFFLAGLLLADIYLDPPRLLGLRPMAADAVAIFNVGLLLWIIYGHDQTLLWTEPFLIAGFYWGVLGDGRMGRLFRSPLLVMPGAMSYTIYLWHTFAVWWVLQLALPFFPAFGALPRDLLLVFALTTPVVIGVSTALFLLVEKPCMVRSREFMRRLRQKKNPAMAASA